MELHVKKQMYIAACLYLGLILVGFGIGWTAPIIPKLQDPDQSPLSEHITETEASLIGSFIFVGTVTGPYISGILLNLIGRKPCLVLGGFANLIAFLLLALAKSLSVILLGRVLAGLGGVVTFVTVLVYIGEIASTNFRGILLTGTGIFTTLGTVLVYSIGPYLSYSVTGYVATVLAILNCIGVMFIPETPLYFAMKDDIKSAKEVLHELGRFEDIDRVISLKDAKAKISFREEWTQIFTVKTNRKALFITMALNIFQQLSGIMAVTFFATTIFNLAGSSVEPNIATILIGVTQLCASFITPLFIERMGRKVLLLISTAFCCLSLAVLGLYFYLEDIGHPFASRYRWLPLVCLIIYVTVFMGLSTIPSALVGEMFQSNVRSTGSAVVLSVGCLFGFGVATSFGYMITAFGGHVVFWVFACACAIAFLFTLMYVPETKGKSLIEIQEMLSK